MFSSGPNYPKLKTNLRLAVSRLKLLEKKKTELALKARKEIADYISDKKIERAKIRVEHIIREDYIVEAMEIVEMYCDLLLARFGLLQQMKYGCLCLSFVFHEWGYGILLKPFPESQPPLITIFQGIRRRSSRSHFKPNLGCTKTSDGCSRTQNHW
jgi:hypothetical protein